MKKNIFILMARYVFCFSWYSRFREWLTIPNTTTGTIISRLLIYRMENRLVMETIESAHYPNKTVNTSRRRSKDGPLVEGPGEGRYGVTKSTAIGGAISRPEKRALDRHEPSRTSPGPLPDVFAKRGRSNPRDRDSINIRRRGPALDLIIRFDRCR